MNNQFFKIYEPLKRYLQPKKQHKIQTMFLCECNPENGNVSQLDIIQSKPEPCRKHNKKQIHFVCKDCQQNPLLCNQCIDDHHGHSWINIKDYFTPDIVQLFTTGRSRNGKQVEDSVETLMNLLDHYSKRLIQKIKETQVKISHGLQRLKKTFPLQGGYKIQGNRLTNKEMSKILQIVRNQEQTYNCAELQKTFKDILEVSEQSINQNLDQLLKSLDGHQWEVVNEEDLYLIQKNYVSRFQPVSEPNLFVFSATDKSPSIRLQHAKRLAIYQKQIPKFPVALAEKCLSPEFPKIRFKIMKMEKSLIFFECSKIFVGLCIPQLAESFSYSNLCQQSKGAYMISSDGRAYHSKLPQYNNIRSHWSFGQGDVIKVGVDFERGVVYFQKNSSKVSFGSRFQMRLGLDKNYMLKLRPCIMFGKEAGAEVAIYNKKDAYVEGGSLSTAAINQKKSLKDIKSSKSISMAGSGQKSFDKSTFKKR